MRLVVDTNVLISALLNPGRTPDRAMAAIHARGDAVLYDDRVVAEYREVLARKKFRAIDPAKADALVTELVARGERVTIASAFAGALIDDGDRMFVEVALAGRADALVTGNVRHYPTDLGFDVLPPAAFLTRVAIT